MAFDTCSPTLDSIGRVSIRPLNQYGDTMVSSIDRLLKGSRLKGPSSEHLWSGITLERRIVDPIEREEDDIDSHYVMLWRETTVAERAYRAGRFERVVKRPGFLSLGTAGRLPAVRALTPYDVTVCTIDANAARTVLEEIDERRSYRLHDQLGIRDEALAGLIGLLSSEVENAGESGLLYQQSLEQALIARFLHVARSDGLERSVVSPLPPRVLRRILDKIESEHENDLTLDELARGPDTAARTFKRCFVWQLGNPPSNISAMFVSREHDKHS
ncbi:hypothetical protein FZ934_20135 (plasmid) [Rhizobium grahamii]|uniref:AraC family transcriptional regulator n=1 Tax=Rhizobium grahamii TaxID=1120045 RepID=A0A5Q0CB66_9HYPH|nr:MULTISPECIES: hypothetical protein [Rhizobium]QFY62692.1 hypothetical protein FZ934_20135 [Rhizobium grahamii]